jgi:hypothetical protein
MPALKKLCSLQLALQCFCVGPLGRESHYESSMLRFIITSEIEFFVTMTFSLQIRHTGLVLGKDGKMNAYLSGHSSLKLQFSLSNFLLMRFEIDIFCCYQANYSEGMLTLK